MGTLTIGPDELAAIQEVLYRAARPENVWDPPPPGSPLKAPENPLVLGMYRTIYKLTRLNGEVFKHLAVFCHPRDGLFPGPAPVLAACRAFGYTGPPESWTFGNCDCGCLAIHVMQRWQAPLLN